MTSDSRAAIVGWITATVTWTAALILVLGGYSWHWFAACAVFNAGAVLVEARWGR